MVNKVCFIDRDGVINKLVDGRPPWSMKQFELLPKVEEAIINIKNLGYYVIVATNQPDPQDGLMPWEELNIIHTHIRETLEIDDLFAAYTRGQPDYKPNPGMLIRGLEECHADRALSWMIGDSEKDIIAGHKAGINTIWVNNDEWKLTEFKPDYIVDSLYKASFII